MSSYVRRRKHGRLATSAVIDCALALADAEGLDGVTLRRVAANLGVTAMALYSHVQSKSDLMDRMADRVLAEVVLPDKPTGTWTEQLRQVLLGFYAVLDEHPAIAALVARPITSPAALRITERLLSALHNGGFTDAESVRIVQVMTGMVVGPAVLSTSYARAARIDNADSTRDQGREAVAREIQSRGYPELETVLPLMRDWSLGLAHTGRLTVDIVVSGLAQLAARHRDPDGDAL